MTDIRTFSQNHLPAVERAMQETVAGARTPETQELHEMMAYHMGWEGEGAGPQAQGKRVRPLLVLLSFGAAHKDEPEWEKAIPAAAAVELLHNFSLIHDDIQDNSPLRRSRPTLWTRWGIPQAINAGDAMYTLAYQALLGLAEMNAAAVAVEAQNILQKTCIHLTQGQYLDISFETRTAVTVEEYWAMIGGKTAALLAACTELGALPAGVSAARRTAFREFGRSLGLAFQVQDDILGIWGEENRTGKSTASDLAAGKKSLPVIYGLTRQGAFASRWREGPVSIEEAPSLAVQLEAEGARDYADRHALALTDQALGHLRAADPQGESGKLLTELAGDLLQRQT